MKHIFLLLLLAASTAVMAQESIPQDTTIYLNGRKMVVKENNGKIKVKLYEAKEENDTIENTQVFEGVYLDGRSIERTTNVSVPFMKKKKGYYSFEPHYPAVYFGFNKLSSNSFRYSAGVPQIGTKSWEWGINPFSGGIAITRDNHWGVTSALGLARMVYKMDNNFGFEKVDGVTVCRPAQDDIEYQKSWLRYWAFRVPVSLEWQTKFGSRRAFIAAGVEGEWRVGIKSRAKYNDKKHTLSSNLNANPLGLNLLLQAGYGSFGFNARFALTPLLEKSKAPELYPASLGIGWYW